MIQDQQKITLKMRIAITVLVIILVPIILSATIFYFFTNYKVNSIGQRYGIENPTFSSVYNNVELISRQIQEAYEKVRSDLRAEPRRFEDLSYLRELNGNMEDNASFVAVRKGEEIYFNGSENISDANLLAMLPPASPPEIYYEPDGGNYVQAGGRSMFKQIDVTFRDGTEGALFLISPTDRILPEIREWATQMVILVVALLIVTCVGMGYWLYRSIVRPLGELKQAAQNVRDGNLDFQVQASGVQELNDLCNDFEEMRVRLKESAEEKVVFDSQHKELISNISHDLKTPLTSIRGYVEGISDGVANTPEKLDRYMQTISGKVGEMTRLLDELTLYSQIDTNKMPYVFVRANASECFESCVRDLRIDLEEQGIRLDVSNYLEEGTQIIVDAEQFRRVVSNIISNSVKYMDKTAGRIEMRLRDAGDFVQVEIEDNGRGIAREELPRIFDRFYRTDASRNTRQGGSGIGLSIVRKIIEDHGGRVWASSEEGEGTTIYFTLRKFREESEELTGEEQGRRSRRKSEKERSAKQKTVRKKEEKKKADKEKKRRSEAGGENSESYFDH